MNGWWIVLAGLGFLVACLCLAMWGMKSAYRREADEYAEPDDTENRS